jgi:hypothetical protein
MLRRISIDAFSQDASQQSRAKFPIGDARDRRVSGQSVPFTRLPINYGNSRANTNQTA